MRKLIHNTTAVAACLSLLGPHLALAETRVPDEKAMTQMQARAEQFPELTKQLAQEMADGLTAKQLTCADGSERPCANGVALVTPGGVAVNLSESGRIFLAGKAGQASVAHMTKAKGDQKDAKDERKAEKQQSKADKKADKDAEKAQKKAERQDRKDEKNQQKAQREAEKRPGNKPAQSEEALQAALAAEQAKAERPSKAERAQSEEERPKKRTEARETKAPEQKPASKKTDQAKATDRGTQGGSVRLVSNETADARAEQMGRLNRVLLTEVDDGLKESQLSCLSGGTYPCKPGERVMTPQGVVLEPQQNGRYLIASAKNQMFRVTKSGDIVERAAEEDTKETAAAKEAARQTQAPKAAALTDESGKGNKQTEQKVTKENTRSSSQDFTASLRDALAQTTGQSSASRKDDDSNDLTKALLLGLGAIAAGSMLNNNRQVALSTPDRVVVTRDDGSQEVIKDEVALLRQPGSTVSTENFDDGSSRTVVTRPDGSKVVTIRDADLRVLRRTLVSADGKTTRLIDDTDSVQPVDVTTLPEPAPVWNNDGPMSEAQLREALRRESQIDRRFTLGQIRNIPEVRALVAPVNIDAVTFDTGSAAIKPDQARQLAGLGEAIQDSIAANPQEIYMVEGYTDTVGPDAMNLALSDRRAESVALALTEYFDVPPENLVVQGYGEQFLKVRTEGDIRANRRASVRRITDLLQTASAQ